MRKQVFGRKFKRTKNQRKALFSGLVSAMILRGRIKTTEAKAKAIKSDIEKLVTKAKKEEKIARNLLKSHLKPFEIDKMISQIAPGFKNRTGGYTRIVKTGSRVSDNASMVVMQWSEMEKVEVKSEKLKVKSGEKKDAKEVIGKKSVKTVRKSVKKSTKKGNK